MALKGNLRDFNVAQLLNLINVAHKTGKLVVENGTGSIQACFREGKLVFAQEGQADANLAAVLYQAKKLNAAQFQTIQERTTQMSDKELGLLLINANYVTQQDILSSLQNHFLNIIGHLLALGEGTFQFENDQTPPENKITVRIGLENIIIEATRRTKEIEQLQDEIPSLDMALKFVDRPDTNIRDLNLSVEEWRVVRYVNPKNSIRQIAEATKMSDLEIRRIVFSLLQAGLVEIVRPPGAPAATDFPFRLPSEAKNKEEEKSLVNRLISRIRSI